MTDWRDPSTWADLGVKRVAALWALLSYWRRAHERTLQINLVLSAGEGFRFELA